MAARPFESARLWQPWSFRAITGADWSSVLQSWAAILDAVFIATIAILLNISGSEVVLDRDLETNDELQAAGTLNVVSGARRCPPRTTPCPSPPWRTG